MRRTLNSQVQRIEFNDYWVEREAHGALCQGKQVTIWCYVESMHALLSLDLSYVSHLMRCNAGLIQFDVHFLIRDICVRSVAVHFQTGRLSLLLIWHKYDFYF